MASAEYNKWYYNTHKEYFKEYRKGYYKTHKDYYKDYYKFWTELNEGQCVYFHINTDGKYIYIGSTNNLKLRQSCHLTGNSNLKMDIDEYMEKYNFEKIMYKDFYKYNLNGADLRYIEKYFKERYGEIIKNDARVDLNKLSKTEDELIEIAEKEKFIDFKLSKYMEE